MPHDSRTVDSNFSGTLNMCSGVKLSLAGVIDCLEILFFGCQISAFRSFLKSLLTLTPTVVYFSDAREDFHSVYDHNVDVHAGISASAEHPAPERTDQRSGSAIPVLQTHVLRPVNFQHNWIDRLLSQAPAAVPRHGVQLVCVLRVSHRVQQHGIPLHDHHDRLPRAPQRPGERCRAEHNDICRKRTGEEGIEATTAQASQNLVKIIRKLSSLKQH